MPIYDIAGLKVNMINPTGRTAQQAKKYLAPVQDCVADITIEVSDERVQRAVQEHPEMGASDWYYMLSGNDFYVEILRFGGILLHSSCVVVDGVAYAFAADSGVGKSTHTGLWLQHFGKRAYLLNDDKPAIREINGTVYACGTPWSGKHDISVPEIIPLGGICFVERGEENRIARMEREDVSNAVFQLLSQTLRRLRLENAERLLDVVELLFSRVPMYRMQCTVSEDAAVMAYGAMKRTPEECHEA